MRTFKITSSELVVLFRNESRIVTLKIYANE